MVGLERSAMLHAEWFGLFLRGVVSSGTASSGLAGWSARRPLLPDSRGGQLGDCFFGAEEADAASWFVGVILIRAGWAWLDFIHQSGPRI